MVIGRHRMRTWIAAAVTADYEPVGAVSAGLSEAGPVFLGLLAFVPLWRATRLTLSRHARFALALILSSSLPLFVLGIFGAMTLATTGLRFAAIAGTIAIFLPLTLDCAVLAVHWWNQDLKQSSGA